jgi:hypothetical protein
MVTVAAAKPSDRSQKVGRASQSPNDLEVLAKHASHYAPPWMISMVLHIILMLALALVQLGETKKPVLSIEASYSDAIGEQTLDDSVLATALETVENVEPAFSKDVNPTDNPLAAMPKVELLLDGPGSTVNLDAPSIGMALTGREKGAKNALLSAYGGSGVTEGAVGMGLEWLRRNQQRDGSWSLVGPYSNGVTVENRCGATAMALLAFQGNGHTHLKGDHRDVVNKGVKALLKMQDNDGNFFREGMSGHRLYSQAMATIVVCELYGMTQDAELKVAAERALKYAVKIQADDGLGGGGWRYQPGQDADLSVTGWFVMAFQSARMAGLEADSQTLERVSKFLDHVEKVEVDFDGSIKDVGYYYRRDESNAPPRLSMTAEALLCRQYLGWERNEPKLQAGVKKLLQPDNQISWKKPNLYYWYYATQVMHHMGGDEWHQWNRVLREELPKAQEKSGKERGSWSPSGDEYGYQGGRMYSTCFCVFMLESYYRHLPIYRRGS